MDSNLPVSLQHLTPPERVELAQALWDSVADLPRPPLSEARRAELLRRADEHDANPEEVTPWEQVKARIASKLSPS